ncbi:putative copper resistance protein D [Pseudonocardia alni]|uniref:Copper resistance protein D n=1 Tax=Pseudonocardia alni TaxID=33907 RepID=A0AA44ZSI8_PSEA5|nr:cytochrome c oxidase assembly protein [Pseudonocardia alni]PKB41181.1 putative copper resistance protein D [Pseudonocardia alni]
MTRTGTIALAMRPGWSWLAWWVPVAVLTGLTVATVAPDIAVLFGYRSLGVTASVGQPLARTLAIGAASVAVAGLLAAVVHAPGTARGALSPTGYAALQVVRPAGLIFAASAIAVALLTIAESIGIGPGRLLQNPPALVQALLTIDAAAGWVIAALMVGTAGLAAGTVLTWRGATGVFVVLLAGLIVPPATATSNSERSHDWYGDAVTVHTVAATLWIGSTLAIWWLGRGGEVGEHAMRRHDRLAIAGGVVLVMTGAVPFALDVGVDGLTSEYGLLVAASAVALIAGLAVARGSRRRGSGRLGLVIELITLTAATAAGAAMTRLIPPGAEIPEPLDADRLVFLLGYELPDRMGWAEIAGLWRVDLLFAPAAVIGAVVYMAAVSRLRRRGGSWPRHRSLAWSAGCLTVLVATSSGIGAFSTAVFGVHLVGHALLATVAPVLLVWGHPLTLLRCGSYPGASDRIDALLESGPMRALHNPAVAWTAAAVSLFGVYATGLFDAIVLEHWSHPAMNTLALATGTLLFRAVLGARDPEPPVFVRLGLLFAVMMLHSAFAIWLLLRAEPVAGSFYAAVAMPFIPDLLAGQRHGAVLAWLVSDLAVVAAALVVVRSWGREPGPGIDPTGVTTP